MGTVVKLGQKPDREKQTEKQTEKQREQPKPKKPAASALDLSSLSNLQVTPRVLAVGGGMLAAVALAAGLWFAFGTTGSSPAGSADETPLSAGNGPADGAGLAGAVPTGGTATRIPASSLPRGEDGTVDQNDPKVSELDSGEIDHNR